MSDCCAPVNNAVILACSGGSNVGQIANEAAKALDQLGQGRMSCGISVALGLPKFIEAVRDSVCVALDGCPTACVKQALLNVATSKEALYDLAVLESVGKWHGAYFTDYHHEFGSIGRC